MPKQELISIAITTYNRPENAKMAIQSIINQTYYPVEILVVEDGSKSDMEDWLKEHDLQQVIYKCHEKNKGLAAARNTAIGLASGRYFSFCDDDDLWPADLAERLVGAVQSGPESVKMALALDLTNRFSFQKTMGTAYPSLRQMMYAGCTPPVSSQLYETQLLKRVGGYNTNIRSGVDHDLWISLADLDPLVAISWGPTAIINNDLCADRITTHEEQRREKIKQSLSYWKPKIVKSLGEDFYWHFCYSYEQYLNYKFFRKSIQKRDYAQAVEKIFGKHVLKKIIEKCLIRVNRKVRCGSFPPYEFRKQVKEARNS